MCLSHIAVEHTCILWGLLWWLRGEKHAAPPPIHIITCTLYFRKGPTNTYQRWLVVLQRYQRTMMRLFWISFCCCGLSLHLGCAFELDTNIRAKSRKRINVDLPPPAPAEITFAEEKKRDLSLETYMTLPVEQYVLVPMPLNAVLSRDDDAFRLTVPTMTFFNIKVQPVVSASVILKENQVVISSSKCRLEAPTGEPSFIDDVRLNERFEFSASCTLTWAETPTPRIFASTEIHVEVDPPSPFDKLPKRILEKTGNAAMRLSMNFIIKSFLKGLSKDYCRWARDAEYREMREALSHNQVPVSSD